MSILPRSLQNLINQFGKLPGIGPKTASRLAFYLLKRQAAEVSEFADAVASLQKDIVYCENCYNMAEASPCRICSDPKRDRNLICVVEEPLDVVAMAQIREFQGVYHVLGGAISPLDGIGPDNLKIGELFDRLRDPSQPKEIILATNPSMEGEATAMLIARQLKDPRFSHVKITRLGRGLPMGAELEYADEYTLAKALEGRREL